MKKLVGLILTGLFVLGMALNLQAEENGKGFNFGATITPQSLEGDMVYSFRWKELTGAISLKAGSIWNNWATWKTFACPKLEEYGIGLQVNLIEKLMHGEEIGKLLGVLTLSPGVYVAANLNNLSQIKKIQVDSGVLLTLIRIKF